MLRWAIAFLLIAVIAAAFGFGGVAGFSADVAKIVFMGFIILFVLALFRGRAVPID